MKYCLFGILFFFVMTYNAMCCDSIYLVPYYSIEKNAWGYVDTSGKIKIDPIYASTSYFLNDLAIVQSIKNEKFGIIKKNNQYIINPIFSDISEVFPFCAIVKDNDSLKYGLINLNGKYIIQPMYDYLVRVSDSMLYGYTYQAEKLSTPEKKLLNLLEKAPRFLRSIDRALTIPKKSCDLLDEKIEKNSRTKIDVLDLKGNMIKSFLISNYSTENTINTLNQANYPCIFYIAVDSILIKDKISSENFILATPHILNINLLTDTAKNTSNSIVIKEENKNITLYTKDIAIDNYPFIGNEVKIMNGHIEYVENGNFALLKIKNMELISYSSLYRTSFDGFFYRLEFGQLSFLVKEDGQFVGVTPCEKDALVGMIKELVLPYLKIDKIDDRNKLLDLIIKKN